MDDSADGGGIHSTSEAEDARPSEGVQRSEGEGLQTSEDEGEALHPPEHGHGEAVLPVVRQLRMHPALVLRYVGDTHMKSVASLCLEGDMRPYHAPHLEKKHRLAWKNTFETCFGELPRAALPLKAEAKSLGTNTHRLRERMCAVAMTIHCLVRLYWSSMCSWIAGEKRKGTVELIAYIQQRMQDETPVKLRARHFDAEFGLLALEDEDTNEVARLREM